MCKDVKRMSREEAESFTSDHVSSAIKSCRYSRAYGPDSLNIFHLINLGSPARLLLFATTKSVVKSVKIPVVEVANRTN